MDNNSNSGKDSEKDAKKEDGTTIPSRCPFSGVFFDPALLREWENKMKMSAGDDDGQVARLHSIHQHHMMQQNKHQVQDEDHGDSILGHTKRSPTRQVQRVQITNSQSRRAKDLLVKAASSKTVWDEIYNNPSVKEANIRKWNSETVQGVKDGTREIRLEVSTIIRSESPSDTSDTKAPPSKVVYTLTELKELSIQEFLNQSISTPTDSEIEETDKQEDDLVLKLQLICVEL